MSAKPVQRGKRPTKRELAAINQLSRAMSPGAWAEYDAGHGTCSNEAGWECMDSVRYAKLLIRAFPDIVDIVVK